MNICIFCSANEQIDPDFFTLTSELGTFLAANGHTVVFGGCSMGLMECVAKAAFQAGGKTIGIIPRIIEDGGGQSRWLTEVVPCRDLNERKALMMDMSDAFLVLPGGIGTLDEVFTVAAAATIGYHHKPILIYNMKGFWSPLRQLMTHLEKQGMIRGHYDQYFTDVSSLEELHAALENIN